MKREAQATVVANAVAEVDGGRGSHTIILGDYNTFNENALDANDNHPIDNTALILENAAGAIGSQGKDHSTGGYFGKEDGVDVVGMLPQSLRYSEWWDRNDDCVYDPMVGQEVKRSRASPRLASLRLASPRLASPRLASLRLTPPHSASPRWIFRACTVFMR